MTENGTRPTPPRKRAVSLPPGRRTTPPGSGNTPHDSGTEERKSTRFDDEKMRDELFALHPIDIHDLLVADLPKPPELVKGILHQGSKMVIGGGSKSFKTWTLLDLAVSVAAGVPWWGFETTKGRALYVNFEIQDAFFRDRVEAILAAKDAPIDRGQLHYLGMRGQMWQTKYLRKATETMGLSLIIIDPIYKGLGERDENKAGDITKLMNELEDIAVETGAAVVFGHHFSKGNQAGKETIDRMSGSGVFARDPDSILMMTPHEEESVFVVDCILRNFPPVENFCVAREHPLMVRSGEHDPSKLKTARGNEEKYSDDEILAPLREAGSLRNGEWKKAVCAASKMGERTFAMRLRKLVSRGIVTKDGEQYIEVTKAATRTNERGGKKTSFVQGPKAE